MQKKCNSRPFTFNTAKINAARKLFRVHFVDHFELSTFIINVDESTLSQTSKINYSWSKAGRCSVVKKNFFLVQKNDPLYSFQRIMDVSIDAMNS